ncbi:MAG TPA: glycosyltransferase family 39 protein [Saprospiraceae bacterium]|nr:glycosyltransferase family 39 protein [Saprospiraceae bacterium]HPI05982.1 glycosyltransferase family 39 protein [Saprospiraceae bacterium]
MKNETIFTWIAGAVLLAFAILFFCYDLGKFPILQWDEARYVNNSVEIMRNGHWLDFRMDGQIDTWNFKPPLVLWLQVFSMKLWGATEWGVRFPTALAGIGIVLLLFWFGVRVLRSPLAGLVSGLFFLASGGFIGPHMGRTADLDAVQTFFITLYSLVFIRYLLEGGNARRYFALLGTLVVLSFLCKGMPGLLILPYLFIISLLHGNYKKVFPVREVYVFAAMAVLMCAGYYVLRDWSDPGYWQLVKKSEFNRFSGKGVEWHVQPPLFYVENFIASKRYYPLLYLLPFTLAGFAFIRQQPLRRMFLYCWIIVAGYLTFISIPPVKLEWYDAPLYPFFALIFGIAVSEGASRIAERLKMQAIVPIALALTLAICGSSYRRIWEKIHYAPEKMSDFEWEGVFVRQLQEAHPDWLDYVILKQVKHPEHLDQAKFYQKTFEYRFSAPVTVESDLQKIHAGQKILVSQPALSDSIRTRFPASTVDFETAYGKLWSIR